MRGGEVALDDFAGGMFGFPSFDELLRELARD
jgi:hypothetical protein